MFQVDQAESALLPAGMWDSGENLRWSFKTVLYRWDLRSNDKYIVAPFFSHPSSLVSIYLRKANTEREERQNEEEK